MRVFKVVSKYNYYYEREGILLTENEHDLMLKIDNDDYDSHIIFDKSEVEEII